MPFPSAAECADARAELARFPNVPQREAHATERWADAPTGAGAAIDVPKAVREVNDASTRVWEQLDL